MDLRSSELRLGDGGRWSQRSAESLASGGRGKAATTPSKERQSGRWGVVPTSEHQDILVAFASLIRAQRYDMALTILDNELGGGCWCQPRKAFPSQRHLQRTAAPRANRRLLIS